MQNASSEKVFKDCLGIGIDVSKADLAIVGITLSESYFKSVRNDMKAIKTFMWRLHKGGYRGKLICESTGHYHLKLAVVCHEIGLELIVLNPLQSSKHSKAKIRKTKTDPQDAYMLATMCITEPDLPQAAQLTIPKVLIRLKMGQLASIEKHLQQLQQSLAQYEETYKGLDLELSVYQQALRDHCNSLKRLRKQMEKDLEDLKAYYSQESTAVIFKMGLAVLAVAADVSKNENKFTISNDENKQVILEMVEWFKMHLLSRECQ